MMRNKIRLANWACLMVGTSVTFISIWTLVVILPKAGLDNLPHGQLLGWITIGLGIINMLAILFMAHAFSKLNQNDAGDEYDF